MGIDSAELAGRNGGAMIELAPLFRHAAWVITSRHRVLMDRRLRIDCSVGRRSVILNFARGRGRGVAIGRLWLGRRWRPIIDTKDV
jgi:hypothetical protein